MGGAGSRARLGRALTGRDRRRTALTVARGRCSHGRSPPRTAAGTATRFPRTCARTAAAAPVIAAALGHVVADAHAGAGILRVQLRTGGDRGYGHANELLDPFQGEHVLFAGQRDRLAGASRPRGAPDAVHVVLAVLRQVVVQHQVQLFDVQAAGRDVGGHQVLQLARLQIVDQALALALREIADDVLAGEAVALQPGGHFEGHLLGVGENQRVAPLLARQNSEQQAQLAVAGNVVQLLRDLVHRDPFRRNRNLRRVLHVLPRQRLDAGAQGGAVEHGDALVAARHLPDEAAQVGDESHVEQPVGLVDDQDADLAQVQLALLGEVQQTSGRADRHAHAGGQGPLLLVVAHAAVEAGDGKIEVLAQLPGIHLDLIGKFAGGGHDQGDTVVEAALLQEKLVYGDEKRGGLAGAGLRLNRYVGTYQTVYKGLLLHGRACGESRIASRLEEPGIKIKLFESHVVCY